MNFRPSQDRILVEVVPETSPAGIELPPNLAAMHRKGQVLAVGEGTRFQDGALVAVKVGKGDIVLFENGTDIEIEGAKHVLIREGDVVGICGNIYEDRLRLMAQK